MLNLHNPIFSLDYTSLDHTLNELKRLPIKKVSRISDIPARIIKKINAF